MANAAENEPVAVQSVSDIERALDARDRNRQVYWYSIPPDIAKSTGIDKLGMVELDSEEYLMAANRAQNSAFRLAHELVNEAVRYAGRQSLNTGDGSAEAFWSKRQRGMSKLRSLANLAYNKLHDVKRDDAAAFLLSETTSAG